MRTAQKESRTKDGEEEPLKKTCCPAALKNLLPVIDKGEIAPTKPNEPTKTAPKERIEYIVRIIP